MWWILIGLALAGSETWVLGPQTWLIDEPVAHSEPLSRWTLDRGYVFRIEEEGRPVGAVVVGEGAWEVVFDTRSDAVVTANRMAMLEGADVDALRPVVEGGLPLLLPWDRALFLGNGVWEALSPELVRITDDQGALYGRRDGIEEVYVTGRRGPGDARRLAEIALAERTMALRTHQFDPASLLAVDRWDGRDDVWLADVRTEATWDRFTGVDTGGSGQRWLDYLLDPSGAADPEAAAAVYAFLPTDVEGVLRQDLTRARFAPEADGIRRAPTRVELTAAAAQHLFVPEPGSLEIAQHAVVDLEVRAVGAAAEVVWIDVPHEHQRDWPTLPPLAHAWELDGLTTRDGIPLEWVHLPLGGDQVEGRGDWRTLAVHLPEPLQPGDSSRIRVRWTDAHRYAHPLELSGGTPEAPASNVFDMGTCTNLVRALPRIRGTTAAPVPVEVDVGIPDSLEPGHLAVIGGAHETRWVADGWRWVRAEARSDRTVVAVGRWTVHEEPAQEGFPAIQVALRTGGLPLAKQTATTVRQLLVAYDPLLPEYPEERIEVLELVAPFETLELRLADGGVAGIGTTRERTGLGLNPELRFRNRYPAYELVGLASMLNAHWWTRRGARGRDGLLPVIVGTAYGITAVEGIEGPELAQVWFERLRERADPEDGRIGPLTRFSPETWAGGTTVIARSLPARVGGAAVVEAADRVLDGEFPPSWEGFQAALEASSGADLDGFFDAWVYGGLAPRVELVWHWSDGMVRGQLSSDVPFGLLELPVQVGTGEEAVLHRVRIADGVGAFGIRAPEPEAVILDPEGAYLLRSKRTVASR